MVVHFRQDASAAEVVDKFDAMFAAVDADERARPVATRVQAVITRGEAVMTALRESERAEGRAKARLRVVDVRWDQELITTGSGLREPRMDPAIYQLAFGDSSPSTITRFGYRAELERGDAVLAVLRRYPVAAERFVAPIEARQTELREALEAWESSSRTLHDRRAEEAIFVSEANRELDAIEGALTQLYAGERDLLKAFLGMLRSEPRAKKSEEPAPTT